ncbi:MAG: FAD-dependent oxidoreductase [Bacillota bacterium]
MSVDCDVLVVGAGIHGAGVAQAAAAAGHSVRVLEQHGVASGTSSRSSKLIHGGLRYLEQARFGLVAECLRERELLLQLAPELVRRVPFRIPVYAETRRRPWQLRAGLSLYALLAGLRNHTGFTTLPRKDWEHLDGLDIRGLQAVFQYWDAQTDDDALTRAVLASAQSLGAELVLPAKFLKAEPDNNGVSAWYRENDREHHCRARVLVNAAGPWVADVAARIAPMKHDVTSDLVQGTHLVLDLPSRNCVYYLEVPEDGRAVFLMPWKGKSLLGTTETPYPGHDPAQVAPLSGEEDYLLRVFKRYFPAQECRVTGAFAGLRVLPHDRTRPFERGRELILATDHEYHPRAVSLFGGKLTSYRADALRVMARLKATLPERAARADTRRLRLARAD